jgi:DNA-directed RNA polymerase specialized sigma24 family protein
VTRDVVKADHHRITAIQFRELVDALHAEGRMTTPQRNAVLLRSDGFSWTAVARVTGGTVRTARTHYDRGVKAILTAMEVT